MWLVRVMLTGVDHDDVQGRAVLASERVAVVLGGELPSLRNTGVFDLRRDVAVVIYEYK